MINARGDHLVYSYFPWGGLESVLHDADEDGVRDLGPDERLVSYSYDDNGNLLTTTDSEISASALYTFAYDPQNRVDHVSVGYLPGNPVLDSQYDAFGNRSALRAADNTGVSVRRVA